MKKSTAPQSSIRLIVRHSCAQSQSVSLFLPANVHTCDLHHTHLQTEDEPEADERPPLKAQPKQHMPAVAFRSTSTPTFFVRDGNGQWFEQVRRAWIPVEQPVD